MEMFAHNYFWVIAAMVLAALFTAFASRLFISVIGLAVTGAMVAYAVYLLDAPLAAVIVLSVGAGLIPAVFILAVGFTSRLSAPELKERQREMLSRYWLLPLILVLAIIILSQIHLVLPPLPAPPETITAREMLWEFRKADLIGQVIAILAGVFGVVVLLFWKESKNDDE